MLPKILSNKTRYANKLTKGGQLIKSTNIENVSFSTIALMSPKKQKKQGLKKLKCEVMSGEITKYNFYLTMSIHEWAIIKCNKQII